jgi:hypothetical protein
MARTVTLRVTTGINTPRTGRLGAITQTGTTRTGIRSRTSLIDLPTHGLTRLTVMTNPGTASGTAAADFESEFAYGNCRESCLDTP